MTRRAPWGQGSITEIAPKVYRLRWSAGNDPFTGRRIRETLTLHDSSLTQARAELRARLQHKRTATRLTLGDLIDRTVPQMDVSQRTRDGYRIALAKIPPGARRWKVNDITVTDAGNLIGGLAERHGPDTVRKAVTGLLACWKQAYRNGWVRLDDNPWRAQKLPDVNNAGRKVLNDAELDRLAAACRPGIEAAWIALALGTGARPGEYVQLRRGDVDLEQSTVTLTDYKHGGTRRTIAIDETTASVIADWFAMQDEQPLECSNPYVLAMDGSGGARPWRAEYASKYRWHALAQRAGLPGGPRGKAGVWKCDLPLYALRHTHNSELAAAGVSASIRGTRIGNTETTNAATYTHLVTREDREAAATIERRLGALRKLGRPAGRFLSETS